MIPDTIRVDLDALIAVDSLKEPYRQRLFDTLQRLQQTDEANWPPGEVRRMPIPEWPYDLLLGPYHVFFGWTEDRRLEIRDIVREETLQRWFRGSGANGGAGG